jgi:hypothetical protein
MDRVATDERVGKPKGSLGINAHNSDRGCPLRFIGKQVPQSVLKARDYFAKPFKTSQSPRHGPIPPKGITEDGTAGAVEFFLSAAAF